MEAAHEGGRLGPNKTLPIAQYLTKTASHMEAIKNANTKLKRVKKKHKKSAAKKKTKHIHNQYM